MAPRMACDSSASSNPLVTMTPDNPQRVRCLAHVRVKYRKGRTKLSFTWLLGTGEKQVPDLWPSGEREILLPDPGGVTVDSQGHFAPGRNPAPATTDLRPDGAGRKGCPGLDPGAAQPPQAMNLRPSGANTGQDHIQTRKLFPSRPLAAHLSINIGKWPRGWRATPRHREPTGNDDA